MTAHDSADSLTPLRVERADAIVDRVTASEWSSSGSPGIEDVDGAARGYEDERVVVTDVPVTAVGYRRGSK